MSYQRIQAIQKNKEKKISKGFLTYHKLNLDFIGNIFKAFEADRNLIFGVVQITQMEHDDLVTFL